MNGIRLAALLVAAICLFQLDLGEAAAQPPSQDQIEAMKRGFGQPSTTSRSRDRGSRSRDRDDADQDEDRGSRSSRSRSRSRGSSRSMSKNNPIKNNPLFQLLDANGDGELSLREIDSASRILFELDANEDDAVTADEVEHLAGSGHMDKEMDGGMDKMDDKMADKMDDKMDKEMDEGSARSSRSRSARSSRGSSRGGSTPRSGRSFGALGGTGLGGGPATTTPRGGGQQKANDDDEFASYDTNGDGVLKRGELPRSLRTKMTKMDANGDKEIDEDEYWDYIDNN